MTNFLINLPYHKRWMLPDGKHMYNVVTFGDEMRVSIMRADNQSTVLSHIIDITNPNWKELCMTSQELANKRFRGNR